MRLLDLTLPSPAENLACDEALLNAAEAGEGGEVLRFWESPTLFAVVGYANKVATEVNVAACEARGIPILRRCTGGGTVLQGPGCLNYALVLEIREEAPTRTINSANRFVMERNRATFGRLLNRSVRMQGFTDLTIKDLKFSGNAQRRHRRFLLFHGTFLIGFDLALVTELLCFPSRQPDYRLSRSHREFLTALDLPAKAIKDALTESWQVKDKLAEIPRERITALAHETYATREWNFKF